MLISKILKEYVNNLMLDLHSPNINKNKIMRSIQRNSNNYGKLKMLCRQMAFIKPEKSDLVNDSLADKVSYKFVKVSGNHYYLC